MTEIYSTIIRKRHQLTIPFPLRKGVSWLDPQKPIKIKMINQKKLLVEPFEPKEKRKINWDKIFKDLKIIQEWSGSESLTSFLVKDRESH